MRIGIDSRCLEWQRGGPARYVLNLLKQWPQKSDKHTFVLYFTHFIPDDEFLKNPSFEYRIINGPEILKKRRIVTEQLLMNRQIKKDNLDLFFSPWYTAPWFLKIPKLVIAAWDISFTTHPQQFSFLDRLSLSPFSRHSCSKAAGVITCSHFDAKQIEKYYHISENKIHIVQFAAEDKFNETKEKDNAVDIKKKYNLKNRYLLSLGVIYTRRNVDVIIESFKKIYKKYDDISLVVVGKNKTSPHVDIEALMKPIIDEERGIYLTWIPEDELVEIYKQAYYYICTSTCDGETILLKEAMSTGTPVITSSLLIEAVGNAGIIIEDPSDVDETTKVFDLIFSSVENREAYSKKGLEWIKQFSWDSIINKSIDFFETR